MTNLSLTFKSKILSRGLNMENDEWDRIFQIMCSVYVLPSISS